MNLTHLDETGRARMVDVTQKPDSVRRAVACGEVHALPTTLAAVSRNEISKGNVLTVAQVAGIAAAKRTGDLIPLCHPVPLTHVDIEFSVYPEEGRLIITATATAAGKTGVEMEVLTAVSVAALTVYDMCKAVDREMVISSILLLEKHGGKSGSFVREGRSTKDRKPL